MNRRTTLIVLTILGLSLGAWLALHAASGAPREAAAPGAASPTAVLSSAAPRDAHLEGPEVNPVRAEVARDDDAAIKRAVLRGRCVDVDHRPRSGVEIRLSGWEANDQRVAEHLRDHGPIEWADPDPIVTAADGRFEFRFDPPPPYQFRLGMTLAGHVPLAAWWFEVAPETTRDFGDVVMHAGVRVTGRARDEDGAPRADLRVELRRADPPQDPRPEIAPRGVVAVSSDANGLLDFGTSLLPGNYEVKTGGARLISPTGRVEVPAEGAHIDIVCARARPQITIGGVVVDEAGRPVASAAVEARPANASFRRSTTARDGAFLLTCPIDEMEEESVTIFVDSPMHEPYVSPQRIAWGVTDARLVLRRGLPFEVMVLRDRDSEPIERYQLHIARDQLAADKTEWSAPRSREPVRHENGITRIESIRRGSGLLSVVPVGASDLAAEGPIPVRIGDSLPGSIVVRLRDLVEWTVVVRRRNGTPVVGSSIELLQPGPGQVADEHTRALSIERWYMQARDKLLLLMSTLTGSDGRARLRGPRGSTLAVRVIGTSHRPKVVQPVRFDGSEELEIVVAAGAVLRGRVTPREVIGDLREEAGCGREPPSTDTPETRAMESGAPHVVLLGIDGERRLRFPFDRAADGAALDRDGAFELTGVPPGTWQIGIEHTRRFGRHGIGGVTPTTTVVLTDDMVTEVELDLSGSRRARVRGICTVNDEPFAGQIDFVGQAGFDSRGEPLRLNANAEAAADGRFEVLLRAGRWRVRPLMRFADGPFAHAEASDPITVTGGEVREVIVRTELGRAVIRLIRPDGSPLPHARLVWTRTDGDGSIITQTDVAGSFELRGPPGRYETSLFIRSLLDPQTSSTFTSEHGDDPSAVEEVTIRLEPVTLTRDGGVIDLALPSAWDR